VQLSIVQGLSKGMMGGVKFEVSAKVALSEAEARIVRDAGLGGLEVTESGTGQTLSIDSLVAGVSAKYPSILAAQLLTKDIHEAFQRLADTVKVARTFGRALYFDVDTEPAASNDEPPDLP
jgi:hypothetical protein